MYIADIIWLSNVVDKLAWKHSVMPEEVDQVLFSNPLNRKIKKGHRPGEHVYAALGQTDAGRYLIVFYVYKKTKKALILSARDMERKERKLYEKR